MREYEWAHLNVSLDDEDDLTGRAVGRRAVGGGLALGRLQPHRVQLAAVPVLLRALRPCLAHPPRPIIAAATTTHMPDISSWRGSWWGPCVLLSFGKLLNDSGLQCKLHRALSSLQHPHVSVHQQLHISDSTIASAHFFLTVVYKSANQLRKREHECKRNDPAECGICLAATSWQTTKRMAIGDLCKLALQ